MTPPRILPVLDATNRPFWTGGHQDLLLLERCINCSWWQHPPAGRCLGCDGDVEPAAASGRGAVYTWTENHQPFHPDVPSPYLIAIVELVEQHDLRLVTNLVGCAPDAVTIGMPVQVGFELHGEHAVPVFRPVES